MSKNKIKYIKELKKLGIKKNIRDVIDSINGERFFSEYFKGDIYDKGQIPIGNGEKSDDPIFLAKIINHFSPKKTWRVLEIGTGSGYSTAILSNLVKEVVTIEYHESIAKVTKDRVIDNGIYNVKFFTGDGTLTENIIELGDFDGIVLYNGCMHRPFSLLNALDDKGVAIFPMGMPFQQQITKFVNDNLAEDSTKLFTFHDYCNVESVKGKYGWQGSVQNIDDSDRVESKGVINSLPE